MNPLHTGIHRSHYGFLAFGCCSLGILVIVRILASGFSSSSSQIVRRSKHHYVSLMPTHQAHQVRSETEIRCCKGAAPFRHRVRLLSFAWNRGNPPSKAFKSKELRKGCLERASDPNLPNQVAIDLVVGLDVLFLALSVTLSSFGCKLLQNSATLPKNAKTCQSCAKLKRNNHVECVSNIALYIYIYIRIHMHIHIHVHVHIHHIHIHTQTRTHSNMYTSIHPSIHPSMHACMHPSIHASIHTYIRNHTYPCLYASMCLCLCVCRV